MRKIRKEEHIENYFKTEYQGDTLLKDVYIEHNALPELDMDEVDTSCDFLGKRIDFPLMINAMTGGSDISSEINENLAQIAEEFNIPMAVGSQKIALEDEEAEESFRVVTSILKGNSILMSNMGSFEEVENYRKAMDMIQADALQIHLNPVQELVMAEGDRTFKGALDHIARAVREIDKPIIVKEIGFGISKSVAKQLVDVGVKNIDISGTGGTNFIEIEDLRSAYMDFSEMYTWGIPTAKTIIDVRSVVPDDVQIIASGGIRTSLDIVKALAIGGDIVGVSGEILSYLMHGGYPYAAECLQNLIYKTKLLMVLLGVRNIEELKKVPYVTTGKLRELLEG